MGSPVATSVQVQVAESQPSTVQFEDEITHAPIARFPTAHVAKANSAAIEHEFTMPPDGFVSSMERLTAFVCNTTMPRDEHGEVLGSKAA